MRGVAAAAADAQPATSALGDSGTFVLPASSSTPQTELVILTNSSRSTSSTPDNHLVHHHNFFVYVNYLPQLDKVAEGGTLRGFPSHAAVQAGFILQASRQAQESGSTSPTVFQLGNDVVIDLTTGTDGDAKDWAELANSSEDAKKKDLQDLFNKYVSVIESQRSLLKKTSGEVILLTPTSQGAPTRFAQAICAHLREKNTGVTVSIKTTMDCTPTVNGYRDGDNYIVRIEPEGSMSQNRIDRLLQLYEKAIQMASELAKQTNGRVIISADDSSQKLIAKLLGRLHQVQTGAEEGATGAEYIRKRIQNSASGRHLKNLSFGTRYFFVGDLETLVARADIATDGQAEPTADQIEEHRQSLLRSISELADFLENKNRSGFPEARIFLVDPQTNHIVSDATKHQEWAERFRDIQSSIERSSANWVQSAGQIKQAIINVVEELKNVCDPTFHKIDLQSPNFVEIVNRVLRSDSKYLNLGEEVSTPLLPLDVGYFDVDHRGAKSFRVTSQDEAVKAIITSLFDTLIANKLQLAGCTMLPSQADYIVAYKPASPISQALHPTAFIRRFGHSNVKDAYVIEWGKADGSRVRMILDSDVNCAAELQSRAEHLAQKHGETSDQQNDSNTLDRLIPTDQTPTSDKNYSAEDIAKFIAQFVADQYRCFEVLLSEMSDTQVKLANRHFQFICQDKVFRARLYVDGKRLDLMKFTEWDVTRLERVLDSIADLMAAGIIAQLPNFPPHEIVVSANRDTKELQSVTLLSPTESFCNSSGVSDVEEYLKIAENICGITIARLVSQIHAANDEQSLAGHQARLIGTCVNKLESRLVEISNSGDSLKEKLNNVGNPTQTTQEASGITSKTAPDFLQIAKFLPLSAGLVDALQTRAQDVSTQIALNAANTLELIREIAPPPKSGESRDNFSLEQIHQCANTICDLLGRHAAEPNTRGSVLDRIRGISQDFSSLSIPERTWCITLLDVAMRIEELQDAQNLVQKIAEAFKQSHDSGDFYDNLSSTASELDIPFETIRDLYAALSELKPILLSDTTMDNKKTALRTIIDRISIFSDLINGR